jgi:drug/metabolite transporter (DMT)-like permease
LDWVAFGLNSLAGFSEADSLAIFRNVWWQLREGMSVQAEYVLIEFMRLGRTGRTRIGLSPAFGLLPLSALWALASLRTDLLPHFGADTLSPVQGQAVLFCIFTAVAASIAVARRVEFPRGRRAWACAGIGFGLFVVPATLAAYAQDWVSTLDRVAVFSITPVFAVVLEPYLQGSLPRRGKAALGGALAAVAGILCLLPIDIPGSFRSGAALCILLAAAFGIAATNCFAVRLARNLAGRSTLPMAAQAGAASAACFAVAAGFGPRTEWRWSALWLQLLGLVVIDLPALFLLFWLMRRLAASRITARFLFGPLFTILAGMALEPTSPPVRAWLGMALLAGGAGWLAFAPVEEIEMEELDPMNALTARSPRRGPPYR